MVPGCSWQCGGHGFESQTALRVRGISGIRVADSSVMPSIVTGYTIATVYATAERAAELISEPAATKQQASMGANL
jgi:choline dehydrogenase-like flavoprotein